MPKDTSIQSVLVIGSGPIVIGQAAEFDYSGTQACLALKEEGVRVILVNNNPATVMTDEACADQVYFEPLTTDSIEMILEKEQPDGVLATLGGQTGLNLALAMNEQNVFERHGVRLLGTSIASIMKGEDREEFRALMHELNEPVPESEIVETVKEATTFAAHVGYPIIVRPAYTLGGGGGGIAPDEAELRRIVAGGLEASPITQCLVEKSIAGFKEVEYEVMRDANDTCITVCNMENIDPVGIHTGDSIVTAPSQTLTDEEYQMLRTASLKIIRALGVIGGCNIQFALDPHSKQYYLIEVNPRVSRSSALASKATGYPIARMAAKISLGYHLHELKNPVTKDTYASFEPALDYVVTKIPRWPFDKFPDAERTLGTQMKATGEVMALEQNLEAAFQKAVRSLEIETFGLEWPEFRPLSDEAIWEVLYQQDDRRYLAVLELMRRGVSLENLHDATGIQRLYLRSWMKLITAENDVRAANYETVTLEKLKSWKHLGFSDEWLAYALGTTETELRNDRMEAGLTPTYHMVDTCAAEFEAETSYFYSSWGGADDQAPAEHGKKALVLGSGPIRIGQGIEFDYCSVHGVFALQEAGYETIIMNNNPETVSTDYATADRLYFEPLTAEDVIHVAEREQVDIVIVQLGGQTAIDLTKALESAGLPIAGTTADVIDQLEDRDRFYKLLKDVGVPHIPGEAAANGTQAVEKAENLGFPVLLRPSYVIGGQGMVVYHTKEALEADVNDKYSAEFYPVLIDRYMPGKELEVDVLTDGKDILIPGVFEHIEKAGVHSGDSMAVTPPVDVSEDVLKKLEKDVQAIASGMNFTGIFNIQFVEHGGEIYVIEVNPRASRTVPILQKVTGVPMIELAVQLFLGESLQNVGSMQTGLLAPTSYVTVKAPVFSNTKLAGLDPALSAEMKSTGELISIGAAKAEAVQKTFAWSEQEVPALYRKLGSVYLDIDTQSQEVADALKTLENRGYTIKRPSDTSFTDWLKDEDSLALVQWHETGAGSGMRREALKARKTIVTNDRTFTNLIEGLNQQHAAPISIETWRAKDTAAQGV
ncbi:carbamoyl-phosphate synthase large subunit [Salsuginibacillus halophilus]|uniref:Carbamoyl phosphate synthase large chain n=1 Tax=Salsuginibacillus halophilus TaxID=517424 RepID=A0A2P8HXK5_9BACI|nr:carbamoyl phosphate synthase large subunit [Salsuginibacillus halophilus]PSL50937.1 carbamoyl-phosphate synthase large subunit [Salsuginibacillus halophilus]